MADEKDLKKKGAANAANGADDGWQEVLTDRPMFKAELFAERIPGTQSEKYIGTAIQGYVLGLVAMPETLDPESGELRPWNAYVFEATAPLKCSKRGSTDPVEVKNGEQFLVAETAILKQALPADAANHPTLMLQARVLPLERAPLPNKPKQKMWSYDVKVKKPVPRAHSNSGNSIIQQMLQSLPKAAGALGDGRTVDTTGEPVS
jgi:hypothetical protein